MGFLRNTTIKLFAIVILSSCSHSIKLQKINFENDYQIFGQNTYREFYFDTKIGDTIRHIWTSETHGGIANTSLTIVDNLIIVPDLSGRIYIFDLMSGKEIGYEKFNGQIPTNPIVHNIYLIFSYNNFGQEKSTIVIFNLHSGSVYKEIIVDQKITAELIQEKEYFYVLTERGKLLKYDYLGTKIWETDTKVFTSAIPAASNNRIIWGNSRGEVIVADIIKGEILFREKLSKSFEAGFTVKDDTAFFIDRMGKVFCFDLDKLNIRWKYSSGRKTANFPIHDKNSLYIASLNGAVICLDILTGKMKWELSTGNIFNTTPLVFKDNIVIPSFDQYLLFIDKMSGKIVKKSEYENRLKMSPTYYKNLIFIASSNGKIFAHEIPGGVE